MNEAFAPPRQDQSIQGTLERFQPLCPFWAIRFHLRERAWTPGLGEALPERILKYRPPTGYKYQRKNTMRSLFLT